MSRRPRGTSRSPGSPTTTARCTPGTLFFCVRGSRATGTTSRPTRSRRGAAALVVERPLESRRARRCSSPTSARRWRRAARFYGDPTATLRGGWRHRHERQDDDGVPRSAHCSRRADVRRGCSGPSRASIGGVERGGPAHHAGGDRPAAHASGRCSTRGDSGLRDGGLLARAGAPSRRRDPLRGGDLHEPDPGPPRLPRTMEAYFAAKRRLFTTAAGDSRHQRRRPVRRRGWPRRPAGRSRSRCDSEATYRPSDVSTTSTGSRFIVHGPTARSSCARHCAGASTSTTRSARSPRRARSACRSRSRRPRSRAPARSRAVRAGRRGPGVRGARRLRPHAGLARERAARGARAVTARRAPVTSCSAAAAIATAASGR